MFILILFMSIPSTYLNTKQRFQIPDLDVPILHHPAGVLVRRGRGLQLAEVRRGRRGEGRQLGVVQVPEAYCVDASGYCLH